MRICVLILALVLASCGNNADRVASDLRTAAQGKNIVMVLLDAAAVAHFGYAGYERDTTPNIDALAAQSLIFDEAYAPAASTAHSVYGLLTSLHSFVQEEDGGRYAEENPFRVTETTQLMPELLAPRFDHRTGISGNAWFGPEFGLDRGFTFFAGAWDSTLVPDLSKPGGGRVLDLFIEDLERWDEGPSFSYVHFLEPHTPYTPPDAFARKFHPTAVDSIDARGRPLLEWRLKVPSPGRQEMTRALYDANIAFVDSLVGELIDALKDRGEWDNTIFILSADHGEAFWQHGVWGHGRHTYDEFVKIPLLVRIPGVEGLAGRHVEPVVSLKDLLPTYLDLLSLDIPDHLQGKSLLPLIGGDHSDFDKRGVFMRGTHGDVPEFAMRYGRYKWIYSLYPNTYQLYDLVADPLELHDLAGGDVARELIEARRQIAVWLATGTGLLEPVDELDTATKARLRTIGYF